MSRKRAPDEAGINMHAKKENLEYEEQVAAEERRQQLEENNYPQTSTHKVKKVARRSLGAQSQPFAADGASANELSAPPQPANPFSAVQFMASSSTPAPKAPATNGPTPQPPATTTNTSMASKGAGYYKNVAALNQHFLSWFQEKMKQDSAAPLTAGVGKYIEYCLQFENGGNIESAMSANTSLFSPAPAAKPVAAAAEAPKSLFASSSTTEAPKSLFASSSTTEAPKSLFASSSTTEAPKSLFASSSTTEAPKSMFASSSTTEAPKSLFASSTAEAPKSLFGGNNASSDFFATAPAAGTTTNLFASAPAATGGGLFGSSTAPATGSLFGPPPTSFGDAGFSSTLFTSPPPQSASVTPEAGGDGEEGDDDNAPLGEDEPVVEVIKSSNDTDEVLFEADAAKVSMLVDKEFKSKGEGRIAFLRNKHDKSKCQMVIRSPTTGKIFFNAPVNQSMKQSIKIKSRSVLIMTLSFGLNIETNSLEPENGGKPGYYRMLLKTEDEAKRLHEALMGALN